MGLYFDWAVVERARAQIDWNIFQTSMRFAHEEHLARASACPNCASPPAQLFWLAVSDEDDALWQRGQGRSGFLTLCEPCHLQVDFFRDAQLEELEAEERALRRR